MVVGFSLFLVLEYGYDFVLEPHANDQHQHCQVDYCEHEHVDLQEEQLWLAGWALFAQVAQQHCTPYECSNVYH